MILITAFLVNIILVSQKQVNVIKSVILFYIYTEFLKK